MSLALDGEPSGPSTNYAQTAWHQAWLYDEFGVRLAEMWFGLNRDMLDAIFGRYVRGHHKGRIRGNVVWTTVTHGGWMRNRGVVGRGMLSASLGIPGWGRSNPGEMVLEIGR